MQAYNLIDDLNGAAKSDIWRYSILWKYGGIYIDFDAVCFKSFDEMINNYSNKSAEMIISMAWSQELDDLNEYLNSHKHKGSDNDNILSWLSIGNSKHTMRTIQFIIMSAPKSKILTQVIEMLIDIILNPSKQEKYKLNDDDVNIKTLTRKITGPEMLRRGTTHAILKYNLTKGIDYEIYGSHWKRHCIHYHQVKGFYKTGNVLRYNQIKNRAFLKHIDTA